MLSGCVIGISLKENIYSPWRVISTLVDNDLNLVHLNKIPNVSTGTNVLSKRDLRVQSLHANLRFLSTPILLLVAFAPILFLGTLTIRRFIQSKVVDVWFDSAYNLLIIACLLIAMTCAGIYLKNKRSAYVMPIKRLRNRSPDPIQFDLTVETLSKLKKINAPSYVIYNSEQVFKRDAALWKRDEFLLFLLGNKALRRALQPDNTVPVTPIYFDAADLDRAGIISNSKSQTSDSDGKHSGWCPNVKALMGNADILDIYAESSDNWNDKTSDEFKFERSTDQDRYHNTIMHFHGNKSKLEAWFTYARPEDVVPLSSADRDTFENELAELLGVDKNPKSKRITKLRYGRYRGMERYLIGLAFIPESKHPKKKQK